jgi:hypothetical protein
MVEWNILATAEPGRDRDLLRELNQWGEFRRPGFRGVLIGHVADVNQFLEAVRRAGEQQMRWVEDLARAFPVEQLFRFTPETFEEQLKEAVAPFVERMPEKRPSICHQGGIGFAAPSGNEPIFAVGPAAGGYPRRLPFTRERCTPPRPDLARIHER